MKMVPSAEQVRAGADNNLYINKLILYKYLIEVYYSVYILLCVQKFKTNKTILPSFSGSGSYACW